MACSQLDRQENLLSDCLDSLKSWKELISKHLDEPGRAEAEEHLNQIVGSLCQTDFENKKSQKALDELSNHYGNNEDGNNSKEKFSEDVDEVFKKIRERDTSTLPDIRQHLIWKTVFSGGSFNDVEEVQETQQSALADDQYEEMQDSLFCSNVFTPPIDPISKRPVENPYKNKRCGHIYEYKFIVQYVKSMKNKAKCPYIGCRNGNMNLGDLKEDSQTKEKITQYLQSTQQTSNDHENSDNSDNDDEEEEE